MSGAEKGEPAAILLSPVTPLSTVESSKQPSGSLFTSFLTSPLQTFALLVGFTGSEVDKVSFLLSEYYPLKFYYSVLSP